MMKRVIKLLAALIIACSLPTCSTQNNQKAAMTGAITAHAVWPANQASPVEKVLRTAAAGVVTVRMIVSGPGMTTMQQDFAASAGKGTIDNVPAGTDRMLTLQGLDSNNAVIYQGQSAKVTVTAGQTTDCGTITMSFVGTAPPGVAAISGDGQNTIIWDSVPGATSYNIYWSTTSGVTKTTGTKIADVTVPYTHPNLTNMTKYYYVVTFVNGNGESSESSQVSTTPYSRTPGINWVMRSGSGVFDKPAIAYDFNDGIFAAVGAVNIKTSPDGIYWTSRSPGGSYNLYGVTYAGTKFVAVGQNEALYSSLDGNTWTSGNSSTTADLFAVTWSSKLNKFVAVGGWAGGQGVVVTSADGITWSGLAVGTTNLYGVTGPWAYSLCIAVGASGTILTSPDGTTWTARTSGTTNNLHAVASSGSLFAAVGDSGTILTSSDGITWASQTSGTNVVLWSIIWSGTQFMAVGDSGTILSSSDGTTWTTRSSGITGNGFFGISWNGTASPGNQFVAITDVGTIFGSPPVVPIAIASGLSSSNSAHAIAVDSVNAYWTEWSSTGSINKVGINGGAVTTLASSINYAKEIAVDSTSVYWTENVGLPGGNGTVKKVDINGGTVTTLASGLNYPRGIAVDSTSVYWAETNSGTVNKVDKNGGTVTTLVSGLNGPYPWAIATDSTSVYWTEWNCSSCTDGTIRKMDKNGGTVTTLASGLQGELEIAVDSFNVYWTEYRTGNVKKMDKISGTITTLASGLSYPSKIAIDSANVYVKETGLPCNITKVNINYGIVTPLAFGTCSGQGSGIAVNSANVYWTGYPAGGGSSSSPAIYMIPKN